ASELRKYRLQPRRGARGVAIEAADARVGHREGELVLELLGARAHQQQPGRAAVEALVEDVLPCAAVVADELRALLVPGHRHRATVAAVDLPAVAAHERGGVPAAVEEDDRLFAAGVGRLERLDELRGKQAARGDTLDGLLLRLAP